MSDDNNVNEEYYPWNPSDCKPAPVKPRVFWLIESRCGIPTRVAYSELEMMNAANINDDVFSVVKYSAYTALQAEVERLTKELRELKSNSKWTIDLYVDERSLLEQAASELRSEVERLTECLIRANSGAEEYECKFYLQLNENEDLKDQLAATTAECDKLKLDLIKIALEAGQVLDREANIREQLAARTSERDKWRALLDTPALEREEKLMEALRYIVETATDQCEGEG